MLASYTVPSWESSGGKCQSTASRELLETMGTPLPADGHRHRKSQSEYPTVTGRQVTWVQPFLLEDSVSRQSGRGWMPTQASSDPGQRASSSSVLFVTTLWQHDSTVTEPCPCLQELQLRVSKHQLLPTVATMATPAGSVMAFLSCWRQRPLTSRCLCDSCGH